MGLPPTTTMQVCRPQVYLWPDGKARSRIDLSPYCMGFNYTKALQQPVGNWSCNLMTHQGERSFGRSGRGPAHIGLPSQLERMIRANGVISIGFDEPGGICMGLVDDVAPSRALLGGSATRSLQLTGSDMAKVIASDHIVHASLTVADTPGFLTKVISVAGPDNALVAALPGVWGPTSRDGVPTFLGETIQDVATWILKTGPSMQVPLLAAHGGTGKPGEFIRPSITSWLTTSGAVANRIWSEAPHTFNGTVWAFIRSLVDEDFYEMIVDSLPSNYEVPNVFLTIRPKPFDEAAMKWLPTRENTGLTWDRLRTRIDPTRVKEWVIPEEQVLHEQLGISDADVFSYYLVTSEHDLIGNPDGLKEGLFYPAVDLHTLQRAGLRAYEARLSLVSSDIAKKQQAEQDYDREVGGEVAEFRNRLFNWYRAAEYMEAGSIVVPGVDRRRVGDPVYLPWRYPMRGSVPGVRYYCVSTTHSWSLGQPYTNTLRLMRGHNQSVIDQAKIDILAAGTAAGVPDMVAET